MARYNQLTRVLKIIRFCKSKRTLAAIIKKYKISKRTAYRDVEYLLDANLIKLENGKYLTKE